MLEEIFSGKSFPILLGKAIVALALLSPLAYCTVGQEQAKAQAEVAETQGAVELQKACIAQRGNWDPRKGACSFDD